TFIANAYAALVAAGGGTLYFPAGIYRISSFPAITANSIRILGDGEFNNGTILRHTAASGDFIVMSGQCDRIERIYFIPVNRKSSGFEIKLALGSFDSSLSHVRVDYAFSGIFITDSSSTFLDHVMFRFLIGTRGILYSGTVGNGCFGCE